MGGLFPEEKILNLGLSGDTSAGLLNRLDDVVGRMSRDNLDENG